MDNFDSCNVLLAIATNISQRLKTGFVLKSHIFIYIYVTPPGPHTATTRRSGSRTRDSCAGGGRSNKERQRLQPLERLFLRSGE